MSAVNWDDPDWGGRVHESDAGSHVDDRHPDGGHG